LAGDDDAGVCGRGSLGFVIGIVSRGGKVSRLKLMSAGVVAGCRRLGLASPGRVQLVGRLHSVEGLAGVGIEVVEGIARRSLKAETYSVALVAAGAVEAASRVGTGVSRRSAGHLAYRPGTTGAEAVMRLVAVGSVRRMVVVRR
jgi:hypothetical protein